MSLPAPKRETEFHYKVTGTPEWSHASILLGCLVEFEILEVAPMEDGAIEITLHYRNHYLP